MLETKLQIILEFRLQYLNQKSKDDDMFTGEMT